MNRAFSFCLIIFVALVSNAFAQTDGGKEKKTFAVKTNLMVLNEKNEYLEGIKESEITLFEDGIEKKLTSFAPSDPSLSVSLVVDNTGSVRTQLNQVINIAKIIVANLGTSDEATVIRFVDRDKVSVEEPWTTDKSKLSGALDNLFVEAGQSAVIDALYLSAQDIIKRQHLDKNKRYAIVLISDGEDRDSYYSTKDLYKLLDGNELQIFTIALTKELSKNKWTVPENRKTVGSVERLTNKIAARSGGTSYIMRAESTDDDFHSALKALIIELRSHYVLGYTATDVNKKTLIRKLTVTVADGPNGEKRKAIIKENVILASN